MNPAIQSLVDRIADGAVGPANARDAIARAGGESFAILEAVRALSSGPSGSGDMLGSNNLSELADVAAARANLGLSAVNNTADADKPISSATQTALNSKVPTSRAVGTSGLAGGGGDLSADRTIDVPIASQAEAEEGAINNKAMTPLRVAEALAALGGGGGSPISNPDVCYIRGDGDDGTGDGSINAPLATFQAAVDAGFRVLDFGVDDIGAPFGGLTWSTAADLTLFIRGCGVGKTTLGPVAFNRPSGHQLTIHDLGKHSFKLQAAGGSPAIACRDASTPGSQASQVNLFGVFVEGDIQASGVAGDSFGSGGTGGAVLLDRGAIHSGGGIYAAGADGGSGDGSNPSGNGGNGGSVVVIDSQAATINVANGVAGSDGGGGAGGGGSVGNVTLQRAVVTSMTPDAATALASCINGVFFANAYP